jgi:hypothetical protein
MEVSSSRTMFNVGFAAAQHSTVNHFHLTIDDFHVAEFSRMPTRSLTMAKQTHRLRVVVSFSFLSHTSSAAFSLAKMKFLAPSEAKQTF